ncbi:MAG: TetR/AcrR family transcriptional regulator [Pelobacteraceae bacterium]
MKIQTPPYGHPVEARERLLAAALEQFALRGYAATSVRELCEAAGVTKPVLYYYFKSKEGLFLQLMEETSAILETMIADLANYPGSARERIVHFITEVFNACDQQLPLIKLIYSILFGTPQGAPSFNLEQNYDRILETITGLVEEGIVRGEIARGNVNDIVWTIMACFSVTLEEQLCRCNPRIDGASMVRMLNLVFNGIAPH